MTKNGTNSANSKQIVSVQSQDGENIGLTYPKRAAGLVKKGRARFVNDNTIRLMDVSDVTHTEDIKMDNIKKQERTARKQTPFQCKRVVFQQGLPEVQCWKPQLHAGT